MTLRVVAGQEVLYEGPKSALPTGFLSQCWDHEVDLARFPGADGLSVQTLRHLLALACGELRELHYEEISNAVAFLDYLSLAQEHWAQMEKSTNASLPTRLVLGALADGCTKLLLVRAVALEWDRFREGEVVRDLAIPLAGAQALLEQKQTWALEANTARLVEPDASLSRGCSFSSALAFSNGFSWSSWFPEMFPWTSPSAGLALAMKGGAVAHMLHRHDFDDMDFYIYDSGNGCLSNTEREAAAITLINSAVNVLCQRATRTLLVENTSTLTVMLQLNSGNFWRVQFFLHIFNSISEILITSDIDATQVIYCGATNGANGLYLSPLALRAYSSGFIAVRSDFHQCETQRTLQRLARYVVRGFGICVLRNALNRGSLAQLRTLAKYRKLRDLRELGGIADDKPLRLPPIEDSGPEELPVRSIAAKWQTQMPLKRSTQQGNSSNQWNTQQVDYADYANGKVITSGRLVVDNEECICRGSHFNVSCRKINTHGRSRVRHSGVHACIFNWSEHLRHLMFHTHYTMKFLLLEDKCSLPSAGALLCEMQEPRSHNQVEHCQQSRNLSSSCAGEGLLHTKMAVDESQEGSTASGAVGCLRGQSQNVEAKMDEELRREEEENVHRAVLLSKSDAPSHVPVFADVTIFRLTRKARSPDVNKAILEGTALKVARERVESAGCDIAPPWANGARLLVPFTQQQFEEFAEVGCHLDSSHILALPKDEEAIKEALKCIPNRERPRLSSKHRGFVSDRPMAKENPVPQSRRSSGASDSYELEVVSDTESEDGNQQDYVSIILETFPDTDSSVGFPVCTEPFMSLQM